MNRYKSLDPEVKVPGKLEYKEFKEKFFKIDLVGLKGEKNATQIEDRETSQAYEIIEKDVPISDHEKEMKRCQEIRALDHPNLLKLVYYSSVFHQESHGNPLSRIIYVFEKTEYKLFTEYKNKQASKDHFDSDYILYFIKCTVSFLAYLQSKNIAHANLSIHNFHTTEDKTLKIMPNIYDPARPKPVQKEKVYASDKKLLATVAKPDINESKKKEKKMAKDSKIVKDSTVHNPVLKGIMQSSERDEDADDFYYFSPEKFKKANKRVPFEKIVIDHYKSDVFTLGLITVQLCVLHSCKGCYNSYDAVESEITSAMFEVKKVYPDNVWIYELIFQMVLYDSERRPNFVEFESTLISLGVTDAISKPVSHTTLSLDEYPQLHDNDYLPQDYVNELENRIQAEEDKRKIRRFSEKILTNGNKYQGETNAKSQPEGFGTFMWGFGDKYTGFFKNGLYDGEGIYYYANGTKYYGMFKNGEPNGLGVRYYASGEIYFGVWKDGKNDGLGIFIWPNGERFKGTFKDDEIKGKGVLSSLSGWTIEGRWADFGKGIGLVNAISELTSSKLSIDKFFPDESEDSEESKLIEEKIKQTNGKRDSII